MNNTLIVQPSQPDEVEAWYLDTATKAKVNVRALVGVVVNKFRAAMKGGDPTVEQLQQFGALCNQSGLNPALGEVSPLVQDGRVGLIIGIDGWIKVARLQPDFDGYRLIMSEERITTKYGQTVPAYITSQIFIKGQTHPLEWQTWYSEFFIEKNPNWKARPMHMLQLRALANGIKRAFGLMVMDRDEVDIISEQSQEIATASQASEQVMSAIKRHNAELQSLAQKAPTIVQTPVYEEPAPAIEIPDPVQMPAAQPPAQDVMAIIKAKNARTAKARAEQVTPAPQSAPQPTAQPADAPLSDDDIPF